MTKKPFSTKRKLQAADIGLELASNALHDVATHLDLEDGPNSYCDLAVMLAFVQRKITEAKRELSDTFIKAGRKNIPLNWKKPKPVKKEITVRDLQAALCC